MRLFNSLRPCLSAALAVGAGGLLASCSEQGGDTAQQQEMKKGFTARPAISELPPAQKERAEAMRKMAEAMARSGPGGAPSAGR